MNDKELEEILRRRIMMHFAGNVKYKIRIDRGLNKFYVSSHTIWIMLAMDINSIAVVTESKWTGVMWENRTLWAEFDIPKWIEFFEKEVVK